MSQGTKQGSRTTLTARTAGSLKPGEWASVSLGGRGTGTLEARALQSGAVAFYFRTTASTGQRTRIPIGIGIDFSIAKERAAELSLRYQRGERDLRAALDAEQRERERQQREAQERAAADAVKQQATLGALLTAYADQLERDGKTSADAVRNALEHDVQDAWPKLWARPLAEVTADDLLAIVATVAQRDCLRQAEKLRAYLRAAYSAGIKARHNAKALPALRELRVTANTAASLTPVEGANKARDHDLSIAELRAYWKRIQGPEHAALRFHLLTGCQRIAQLARATMADVDLDDNTLHLLDRKGRRSEPRHHYVPLIPAALDAMKEMHSGPFVFTLTAGTTGADYDAMYTRLSAVVDAMQTAGDVSAPFTLGDLRRTVETRLAAAGMSSDVRAHLQSHGLGGVQARHYDRHDYMREKRAALETLHRIVTGHAASVTPIRKRKA